MVGDSGPLEVSSSYKRNLGFSQRGTARVNEDQSQEKLRNRESLASSSEYSKASYGSFPTYEKCRVFNILRENNPELARDRRRTVMRPPLVLREGTKKTVFVNFMDLCKT
ncbi:hypothetical protein IFM89_008338 [Coptis chinensis]|uniref:Uncharacterized protein n=1 Tax=Coptis chinensis TaxID=261450 RepID=A0A835I9T8_9MAGN|nr:hypothetical protein IFM89_008338 [Coptis chinensis]